MSRVNHKAVCLVYVLQLVIGLIWYSAAPANVSQQLEDSALGGVSSGGFVWFCVALLCYTYFSGWLLVKANLRSVFDMVLLTLCNWVFLVLPNIFFIAMFVDFSQMSIGYLLSFGFISSLVAACILPFWRSNRSIFKR